MKIGSLRGLKDIKENISFNLETPISEIAAVIKDKITGIIQSTADYSELGILLIVVTLLTLITPIVTVWFIQKSKFHTKE